MTYSIVDQPTNGTAELDGNVVTYTATSETETSDSFTFKVNDGTVDSDAATVTINITLQSRISITAEKTEMYEHETVILTATLDKVSDSNIIIEYNISGTADLNFDYSIDNERFNIIEGDLSSTIKITGIEEWPENNEDDETVIFDYSTTSLVKFSDQSSTEITLKNNSTSFTKRENPFVSLSNSSISGGDFDRDGDMDLAIMGQSNSEGAVTAIYENKEGEFIDTNQFHQCI